MIGVVLIEYLSGCLDDVFVGMEPPEELTDYVIVEQIGSSRNNHIVTTTYAIKSYGASLYEAMFLNERIKAVMNDFTSLNLITRVELETDYNFTDTATKQYRWQAVYDITHYEEGINGTDSR